MQNSIRFIEIICNNNIRIDSSDETSNYFNYCPFETLERIIDYFFWKINY